MRSDVCFFAEEKFSESENHTLTNPQGMGS
jgi:hypothetical protein